ncbi:MULTISPECIES: hypothetical protein [Nostocales]|uniref:hypothetical protein n=2 Tax=Cyanophyceae TaxID=3028117 RepID=UPI00168A0595|nr:MULTISPECIES: hypothetical protein [Nostocales]MBD2488796.1 hypothetical protein [Aulosira sp. FACHB-615]
MLPPPVSHGEIKLANFILYENITSMPNLTRDIAMQRLFIFLYILSHSLRELRMLAIPGEIASNILRNAAYLTQNLNLFVIVIPKELLSTNKIDQTLNQRRNACWVRDMKLITKI